MSETYKPQLKEVSLKISDIECETYTWKVPKTKRTAGLIVFKGFYKRGSAGTDDAKSIQWRINEFCQKYYLSGRWLIFVSLTMFGEMIYPLIHQVFIIRYLSA